jgi:hypothetical protein
MEAAWRETSDLKSKAVILVFLEHYIADAHQPLHTLTRVNKRCESDYGGNFYYVRNGSNESISLHKLWDTGVGYLTRHFTIANKARRLQLEFPATEFKPAFINENNPRAWFNNNLEYANSIYSVPLNGKLNRWYYVYNQKIVRYQLTLAGYRLANRINQLQELPI